MKNLIEEVFANQIKAEFTYENKNGGTNRSVVLKSYFNRPIRTKDKIFFAFVVENVNGKTAEMKLSAFIKNDFSDLEKKFTIDESLTKMQLENKTHIGLPVFISNKCKEKYFLNIKGIKI